MPADRTRVAVVTGASSGIGRVLVGELARGGWAVAAGARRVDRIDEVAEETRAAGGTCFAHVLDVSEPSSVADFFAAAEAELGPIDAVVSNAGVASIEPFLDVEYAELQRVLGTNYIGGFLVAQEAIRSFLRNDVRGDLVFVSSSGATNPWPHQINYGASKVALDAMARGLALEFEPNGIRVTTVRVGPTFTEISTQFGPETVAPAVELWMKYGILRHFGFIPPEVAARTIAFVVSAPPEVVFHDIHIDPFATDQTPEGPPIDITQPTGSEQPTASDEPAESEEVTS